MKLKGDYRTQSMSMPGMVALPLTMLTVILLTWTQEPRGWQFFGWVALAPWVIASVRARPGSRMWLISYLGGLIYFLYNLSWLSPVTWPGYIALCFYLGWYFPLCGYIFRRIYQHRNWPFTLVLPVVWVAQEYLRALMLTGFPWLFLGHSQHESLRLIQLCDVFGVYGLTFLIAMVNGLFCDLLIRPLVRSKDSRQGTKWDAAMSIMVTLCAILAAVFWGQYRLNQGHTTITEAETIAVVQEVIPQHVKESGQSNDEIFQNHMTHTEAALASEIKPELIVWPETMVPIWLNQEFLDLDQAARIDMARTILKGFADYDDLADEQFVDYGNLIQRDARLFHEKLTNLAAGGVDLLIGAPSINKPENDTWLKYNSAFLYLSNGERFNQRYDKMHLVPFGEVVPFRKSWPWLYRMLNLLTPYDHEYTLDAGTEQTVFKFEGKGEKTWRFAVAICYEDVMPQVPRRLAAAENGKKRIDFLLNISNDGWFVETDEQGNLTPSAELIQHLVICKFRAVENRIGIVRSVNTGISAFIRPDGIVQDQPLAGTLSSSYRQRQAVAGFLTDKVFVDSRISPYSIIGDSFAIACSALSLLVLISGIFGQKRFKSKN
ncbi:MAG: apolipoprotein N-acyltransferase [Planctomycetes bacterium]|nr:apolipoprotein N-acyltransferase [Planctomycetota bacterium]